MKKRLIFLILVPLIILAIALTGAHILVERLFILMVLVLLFSYISARLNLSGLRGYLKNPGQHNQAGQSFEVEAVAENKTIFPRAFLKLQVKTGWKQQKQDILFNLTAKGNYIWKNHLSFPQRGRYKLGPLVAEATDPFGLFRLHRRLDRDKEILIFPSTIDLPSFWAESQAEIGSLKNSWITDESSGSISGVREYVPGDSLNRIHWRSTAHTGRLIVKEFDVDASDKVWILPDLYQGAKFGVGMENTEEYTISIAASIAKKYADAGRQIGLIAQGRDYYFSPAHTGLPHLWRILEVLAVAKAEGQTPIYRLLNRASEQFNGNSVAVIITAAADDGIMDTILKARKQGIQIVTILLEAASFGGTAANPVLKTRLQGLNVPTYTIRRGDSLSEALNGQGKIISLKSGTKVSYLAAR
jgi:uncharacterized protein (DUF58 family)